MIYIYPDDSSTMATQPCHFHAMIITQIMTFVSEAGKNIKPGLLTYVQSLESIPFAILSVIGIHNENHIGYIYRLQCQKQVSRACISNYIPQYSVGCNYLCMPYIPASGSKILISIPQYVTKPGDCWVTVWQSGHTSVFMAHTWQAVCM